MPRVKSLQKSKPVQQCTLEANNRYSNSTTTLGWYSRVTGLRELHRSVVTERVLSNTAKLSVFHMFRSSPMVMKLGKWLKVCYQDTSGRDGSLRRVYGVRLRNKERSCEILNVEPLLQIRSQRGWFGRVTRMPQERSARQVPLSTLTESGPEVDQDQVAWLHVRVDLDPSCVEPAELSKIAENRVIFRVLGLSSQRSWGEKRIRQ